MPQLILEKGAHYRTKFLQNFLRNFKFGPHFLIASLVTFVVLITVITLTFSTRQVTKGYVLSKLEAQHQSLMRESEQQEMQIASVKSLNYIQDSAKVKSMIKPGQIVFLDNESAIASK